MKLQLTEAQENAMHTMSPPAYHADGTKISDKTGFALKRKGLASWDANSQSWELTEKGMRYLLLS